MNLITTKAQRYRIAKKLYAKFSLQASAGEPVSLVVEWEPSVPDLKGKLLTRYRAARNAFIESTGHTAAIVEVGE